MGLSDLQSHITQNIPNAVEQVDLLKLAQARTKKNEGPLKLVVDGECCLDRLYGGYYPDWVCGGQWNKMEQFLRNLSTVVQGSNLDLVIFFNGSLEPERLDTEWKKRQEETYRFLEEIHKHVSLKKKPPPKIWWVPPAFLRSSIRLAFRTLHMKMMCSVEDHHKDIVRFCQRNNFHGIIADDPEYLVFDIQRYFSAQKLKLTFKGSLETVEIKLKKVFETLNLPKERFFIFAALLGNHFLSENDLKDLFSSLQVDTSTKASVIEKIAQFTRMLEVTDADKVGEVIANSNAASETDQKLKELAEKAVKCLRYYVDANNTKGNSTPRSKDKKKPAKKDFKEKKNQSQPQATIISSSEGATLPSDTQKLESDVSKVFSEGNGDTETVAVNGNTNGETPAIAPNKHSILDKLLYRVNPEIENVAISRHKSGLMSPYICQILKNKEVKLPALLEDVKNTELPRAHDLFRPLRQRVYAILFNLHHLQFLAKQKNEKVPSIQVKETVYCPMLKTNKTQFVQAVEIGWAVPTVERLWLGDQEECKRKRIRAFLTILRSDKAIILDSTCVPQQMLVLACVLRYILGTERKVLRKTELDAFVAQAFIQDITDPTIAQDIEISNLTMRGIHLSHMFMEGCEMALLANDACGAPIPYMLFCPWLFFNGKVFNYILEQQMLGKSLAEVCGFKMDLVFNIDQLKIAILDGIKVQFVQPQIQTGGPYLFANNAPLLNQVMAPPAGLSYHPHYATGPARSVAPLTQLAAAAAAVTSGGNRNRLIGASSTLHGGIGNNPFALSASNTANAFVGLYGNSPYPATGNLLGLQNRAATTVPLIQDLPGRQRRVQPRGGHLEVAGTIVGSWANNYGPNGHLASSIAAAGRNIRVPMTPGAFINPNLPVNAMSLFDQMRNVGANKVPNRPGGHGQSGQWQKKNVGKSQQKSIIKKPGETTSRTGNAANGTVSTNGQSNSSGKSKGVTFKEDGATANRAHLGPSLDGSPHSVISGGMIDSSLTDGVANEAQVQVEG